MIKNVVMAVTCLLPCEADQNITTYSHDDVKFVEKLENFRGFYKVGAVYFVKGIKYQPKVQPSYTEYGIASWYGPGFHGKTTSNNEIYNQDAMTAAHKTLPLPSVVKVTNLDNGQEVILRVNDRGPYAPGRIIDTSRKASEILGFKDKGVANVKVELLHEETLQAVAARKRQRLAERGLLK